MGRDPWASSNGSAVKNDGALGDDDDAVADDVVGALAVGGAVLVGDAHVGADAAILVENGAFDEGAVADGEVGNAAPAVLRTLLVRLELVGADQHRVADQGVA